MYFQRTDCTALYQQASRLLRAACSIYPSFAEALVVKPLVNVPHGIALAGLDSREKTPGLTVCRAVEATYFDETQAPDLGMHPPTPRSQASPADSGCTPEVLCSNVLL